MILFVLLSFTSTGLIICLGWIAADEFLPKPKTLKQALMRMITIAVVVTIPAVIFFVKSLPET